MSFFELITSKAPRSICWENEPMSKHTSFRIGGCADIFLDACPEDIPLILKTCDLEGIPVTVLGNGSNVLCGDLGIRGLVLCLGKKAAGIKIHNNGDSVDMEVGAGELLSVVSKSARDAGGSGLEFACGIPGSLGGAIVMNAGAYGGEMKDAVRYVDYIDIKTGTFERINAKDCDFSYRHSVFLDGKRIITGAGLSLRTGDIADITSQMEEFNRQRIEKQPLEYPSAGSTFKRPYGYFAGKLISDCGLKGYSVGGAEVSEKHAGFVINRGNATAKDVRSLMDYVADKVRKDYGVELIPEVRFVGEF